MRTKLTRRGAAKTRLTTLLLLCSTVWYSNARLGETHAEIVKRYGKPTAIVNVQGFVRLEFRYGTNAPPLPAKVIQDVRVMLDNGRSVGEVITLDRGSAWTTVTALRDKIAGLSNWQEVASFGEYVKWQATGVEASAFKLDRPTQIILMVSLKSHYAKIDQLEKQRERDAVKKF
jgi:hypothetical protein